MIKKFNHIAIAVLDIEKSVPIYEIITGRKVKEIITVKEQGVKVAIFDIEGVLLELIEPLDLENPIAKFINSRGNAIHHIAYSVDDIEKTIKEYSALGYRMIGDKPRIGAEGKPIIFMHPKSSDGILMEFVEDKGGKQ